MGLDYQLFFRNSDPAPRYFLMVRIFNIVMAVFSIAVAIGILWETFGK